MKQVTFDNLTPQQQSLLLSAQKALSNAYNPYSGFAVGATILGSDGKTFDGVNVENAAYSPCVCAERTAVFSAVAQGCKNFEAIAIIAKPKEGLTKKPTSPCGPCRQVLFEFSQISKIDIEVIMSTTDMKTIVIAPISELLPMGFGPADLE